MDLMDLTIYTDDDLDTLRLEVVTEQERRRRVTNAPQQIASLIRSLKEAGVTEEDLRAAVEDGLGDEQI